jgi:nitronate monooxygenase
VGLTELLRRVRAVTALPLIGAGGIGTPEDVRSALSAGALAVAVGTALLRSPESGASEIHKEALADPASAGTVVTRAFTGRPARALRNRFTDRYSSAAPVDYPAIHHLTSPIRRAAARAGDGGAMNLWAGTGYRHSTADPVAEILRRLSQVDQAGTRRVGEVRADKVEGSAPAAKAPDRR